MNPFTVAGLFAGYRAIGTVRVFKFSRELLGCSALLSISRCGAMRCLTPEFRRAVQYRTDTHDHAVFQRYPVKEQPLMVVLRGAGRGSSKA